jgi:hypothetical protein
MHNCIIRFSDLGVEIGKWAYLKYVERKLTIVDLTFSKKETWFADNVSLASTGAKIRLGTCAFGFISLNILR